MCTSDDRFYRAEGQGARRGTHPSRAIRQDREISEYPNSSGRESAGEEEKAYMTLRERIVAALDRRGPDRLPTFGWRNSRPIFEDFTPGGDEGDFVDAAGHDAVCWSPSCRQIETIDADTFVDEFGARCDSKNILCF